MRTTVPLGQEPVGLSVSLGEIHSCGTQNRHLPTVLLKPALSGQPDRGDGGEAARSEAGDDYWPAPREPFDVIVTDDTPEDTGLVDQYGVPLRRRSPRGPLGFCR